MPSGSLSKTSGHTREPEAVADGVDLCNPAPANPLVVTSHQQESHQPPKSRNNVSPIRYSKQSHDSYTGYTKM